MTQTRKAFLHDRFRRAFVLCTLICMGGLLLSTTAKAAEPCAPTTSAERAAVDQVR